MKFKQHNKIFKYILIFIFVIMSQHKLFSYSDPGLTKIEILGSSPDSSSFVIRYTNYEGEIDGRRCSYPKINGIKPNQVILFLYNKKILTQWTIYENPMNNDRCTSTKAAKKRLQQSKAAFANAKIDMSIKPVTLTIKNIKSGKLTLRSIIVPKKIMQQFDCNNSLTITCENNGDDKETGMPINSFFAKIAGYGSITMDSWIIHSFNNYRNFEYACLSPNKTKLIFIYSTAGTPDRPQVVDLKNFAAKLLNQKGLSLHWQKKYKQSEILFRKAYNQDQTYTRALFNLACAQARLNKKTAAIASLDQVIKQDKKKYLKAIKTDKDLTSLRNTNKYKKLFSH